MTAHIKIARPKKAKAKPKPRATARKSTTKKKSKKPKSVPETRASLMDQVGDLLQDSIDGARKILEGIDTSTEAGETSPALAREAANLNRAIAAISTELRQREKHIKDTVKQMSPAEIHAMVAEYLREIDHDGRKIFRDIIIELDGEKSLFS